ncbi:MAG TPA: hypothetical protein PLW17_03230 [Limnochordia bacterium]|nr:hypothetical protein [Limnochordia bacterium]
MKRIMFDTNIFDKLITDQFFPDVWQAADSGQLIIVTCEIQELEISRINDSRKRRLIQSIPRQVIASVSTNSDHQATPDLIIAHTAAAHCDMFVTEDRRLLGWYQEHYGGKPCYDYQEFISWFLRYTPDSLQ